MVNKRKMTFLVWATKISAVIIIGFGIPFYFGYGNPLPFLEPDFSIWDNLWLTVFPIMFIGLGLGLKFEKTGGFIVTLPILIGSIIGLIVEKELAWPMFFPFIVGVLYLWIGFLRRKQ